MTIMEEGEEAVGFQIYMGKAGASLASLTACIAELMTASVPHVGINGLIQKFSQHTTDRRPPFRRDKITIRSIPEAIAHMLMQYRSDRFRRLRDSLGVIEDDDGLRGSRTGRLPRMAS